MTSFNNKQHFIYKLMMIIGTSFILYATYALLSYEFQITFITLTIGYLLFGIGLYNFSKLNDKISLDKKRLFCTPIRNS